MLDKRTIFLFEAATSLSFLTIALSTEDHVAISSLLFALGPFNLSPSYQERTDAAICGLIEPPVIP